MSCNNWKKIVNSSPEFDGLNWQRISMSNDGKYQTAVIRGGNIYISHNYGKKWEPVVQNFNFYWTNISVSYHGKIQSAVIEGGNIYNSYDYGKTWTINESAPIAAWYSVAMSKDGEYQTALANGFYNTEFPNGFIYTSKDYGKTWKKRDAPNNCWLHNSMSSDGKNQIANSFPIDGVADPDDVMGYLYKSNDYGKTWKKNKNLKQNYYTTNDMSSDGKIQITCSNNCNYAPTIPGNIEISYNYGKSWSKCDIENQAWIYITLSGNGKYIVAVSYQQTDENGNIVPETGGMYSSKNYGKTWKKTNAPLNTWDGVSISKKGNISTAVAWGSGIFTNKCKIHHHCNCN